MRKRKLTITIADADDAWRVLRTGFISGRERSELLKIVIKDADPKRAYFMLRWAERADETTGVFANIILDSGIDAPRYFNRILELYPTGEYRKKVIEACSARSPQTASFILRKAEDGFEFTEEERDLLVRRVISSGPLWYRSRRAAFALAAFPFLPSAFRYKVVQAAATPTSYDTTHPTFDILRRQSQFFSGGPPTKEEIGTLVMGAYRSVHDDERDYRRSEEAKKLLDIPGIVPLLTKDQHQYLREHAKKKK